MYITKALYFGSGIAIINSFFLINLTHLIVGNMFSIVQNLYYASWAWKSILLLLIIRKGISRITSNLTLANKKFSSKNFSLPSSSNMKKIETTIL